MKNKRFRSYAAGFLALLLLGGLRLFFINAYAENAEYSRIADEIIAAQTGGDDIQKWIDETLTPNAGQSSADFYILALAAQGGYDLSGYANALRKEMAEQTGAVSATSKERSALALIACDNNAAAECVPVLEANAQALGIMSRVYGLHLINNGASSKRITNDVLIEEILALQCADGGWAVTGSYGDPDVTAMVLQAIAPYQTNNIMQTAIGNGLSFLAEKQLETGAYRSYGTENCESTAQVWIALSAIGINAEKSPDFQKNGHTIPDGIKQFQISPGIFSHTRNGDASKLATLQAYLALIAANTSHSIYILNDAVPELKLSQEAEATTVTKTQNESTTTQNSQITNESQRTEGITNSIVKNETGFTDAEQTTTNDTTGSSLYDITDESANETEIITSRKTDTDLSTNVLTTSSPNQPESKHDTKSIPVIIGITIFFAALTIIQFIRKRRSIKTFVTIAVIYGISIAAVLFIHIESPAQYYQTAQKTGGTVTMEIRCDAILGLDGSERFPSDGIIMQKTEFSIDKNENALTLLYDAVKANTLQIEVDGVNGDIVETAYVRGIASLYEFDFGDLSGWTYTVNGERPSVGCGAYHLKDGDAVAWIYTINL